MICTTLSKVTAHAGVRWEEGVNVQLNTDGTTELQNEESVVINPADPDNIVAVWRDFRHGYRRVGVGTSFDGGESWTDSLFVGTPYDRHSDPVLSYSAEGDIYACLLTFNWLKSLEDGIFIFHSSDGGISWSDAITVVDVPLAYDDEDKQWINVDRTGGSYHGRIYVPWVRFTATGTRILLSHSYETPSGIDFSQPVQVYDGVGGVHWPTVTVGPDGNVYVAWVSSWEDAIMIDASTSGGTVFGVDRQAAPLNFLWGEINGGIFTFAFPAMEADISGGPFDNTVYIAYADQTYTHGMELYLTKSTDGAYSWSEPVRMNDDPTGVYIDQFHPWLSINEDGILTAVWYDRRLDPDNLEFDLYMAHSFDGGETWTANRRISEVSSSPYDALLAADHSQDEIDELVQPGGDNEVYRGRSERAGLIGEYVGLSTRYDKAYTVWTDTRNGNQDAFGTRVTIGFAPPPPILPEDSTATTDSMPVFVWGKTGATSTELAVFTGTTVQPLHYILEVDDDPMFGSVNYYDSNLVGTSHQFASPLEDADWYWRVSAVNDSGRATGYLEEYRTLIIDHQPPQFPELWLPGPDETVEYELQGFFWMSVSMSDRGSDVYYQLQVSTDSTFAAAEVDVSDLNDNLYVNHAGLSPASTYYWHVRSYDAAGNSPGFTEYSRFFTAKNFVCGDADSSGEADIDDVVYLIAYIFSGGPPPEPHASGDADCSGGVDIDDVVYLIGYIFSGGNVPCDTDGDEVEDC
jgi:hypothetical protein